MEKIRTELDLYIHISTEMMKVFLGEHMKNPGRGSLDSFLESAIKDVDTIARRYVQVMAKEFAKEAASVAAERTIEVPKSNEEVQKKAKTKVTGYSLEVER